MCGCNFFTMNFTVALCVYAIAIPNENSCKKR